MVQSARSIAFLLIVVLVPMPLAWAGERVPVFVSIAPQKYFVQQIGRDLVDVRIMVPSGADPHTYEPRPRQMVAISKAKLYFAIGIEFEKAHLDKIASTNPKMAVVHMDRGIKKLPMPAHLHPDGEEVQNNRGEDHHGKVDPANGDNRNNRDGLDPHIWLSPPLVKIQAHTVLKALQEIDPLHRSIYERNFQRFGSRIDELDEALRAIFKNKEGLGFMVFHPAWGYFADAYGLKQLPVEIEGKNPKPAQLKKLIQHARENHIRVIFVQPQFSAKSARLVAREIGGEVVFVDPLAENWPANLQEVASKFKKALN